MTFILWLIAVVLVIAGIVSLLRKQWLLGIVLIVVVVVHDINVAAYYSDHIVAMSDGAVMFEGPPHAVICPEVLSEVYGLPVQVHDIAGRPHATYFR